MHLMSFEALFDVLDNFSYISGLKLNLRKCLVLRIGSMILNEEYTWKKTENLGGALAKLAHSDLPFALTKVTYTKQNGVS